MNKRRFGYVMLAVVAVAALLLGYSLSPAPDEKMAFSPLVYKEDAGHASNPGWHVVTPEEIFSGRGEKFVRVNAAEDSLEFVAGTAAADVDIYKRHSWMHEHFDGLNTATIIGQGSYFEAGAWIDDGLASGSTAEVVVKDGSDKMVSVMNNAGAGVTNSYISSMVSSKTFLNGGGFVHLKTKIDQNGSGYGGRFFSIMDGAGGVGAQPFSIYFRYSTTFQIAFWNGAGAKIMDCSKDTWYTIDAYWTGAGSGGGQVTIFVDGVWRYSGTTAASTNEWDRISISAYSPAGGSDCTLDVDDLIVSSTMPLGLSY